MLVLAAATDLRPHDASYLCFRRLVLATQAIAAVVAAAAGGADAARAGVMGAVLGLLGLIDAALLTMRCLAMQLRSRHAAAEGEGEGEAGEAATARSATTLPPPTQPSTAGGVAGDAREMQRGDREMPAVGEGAVPYTRWNTPPISPRSPHTPSGAGAGAALAPSATVAYPHRSRASHASRVRACARSCCCTGTAHAKVYMYMCMVCAHGMCTGGARPAQRGVASSPQPHPN